MEKQYFYEQYPNVVENPTCQEQQAVLERFMEYHKPYYAGREHLLTIIAKIFTYGTREQQQAGEGNTYVVYENCNIELIPFDSVM